MAYFLSARRPVRLRGSKRTAPSTPERHRIRCRPGPLHRHHGSERRGQIDWPHLLGGAPPPDLRPTETLRGQPFGSLGEKQRAICGDARSVSSSRPSTDRQPDRRRLHRASRAAGRKVTYLSAYQCRVQLLDRTRHWEKAGVIPAMPRRPATARGHRPRHWSDHPSVLLADEPTGTSIAPAPMRRSRTPPALERRGADHRHGDARSERGCGSPTRGYMQDGQIVDDRDRFSRIH